jgi:integrase
VRGHVAKRKRKDGTTAWYVVLDVGRGPDGKRRQKWQGASPGVPFKTEREANSACHKLATQIDEGAYVAPTKQTVGEFLTATWLPAIRATLRPSTFDSYKRIVDTRLVPKLGSTRLQRLSPPEVNRLYNDLLEGGRLNTADKRLSPKSVRNVHAVLRRALNDAVRWGLVPRNVALLADPPRARQDGHEMKTWSADELRGFLEHVSSDRLSALWTLLATTGMRRGEAVGLRWSDLDLENARAQVRQTLVVSEGKVIVSEPKTARGRRSVALDSTTVAALKEHRRRQVQERLAAGSGWQDTGLVFAREDGTLTAPDSVTQAFERHVKNAKLPTIRLHDLRHTHASLALSVGIPAKVVSERLGHSSIGITLDVYSHVSPALEEDAAERVAEIVFGSS